MKLLPFLFISLLLVTGCRKDIERLTVETGQDSPPTISGTCTVSGRVLDEDGVGIPGARVSSNFNESDLTDASGRYELRDIQIGAEGNTLYVTAAGYFEEWRNFLPEGGSIHQIDVVMSEKNPSGSINAATGGTFELPSGASLTIQPGSVRQGNTIYNGEVNIAMSFDDPTSVTAMEQSPGNLPAFDNRFRNPRVLASLGMIDLRMTDDNGRSVFIDNEEPAELFFPVPPGFQSAPQDTVFFWQLLESAWIFTNQLSRARDGFITNITGGGTYNCDVPFEQTTVCARLTSPDGTPLTGQLFSIAFETGPQLWTFRTDNRGRFCANVAIDRPLEIIVPGLCPGDPPFSITIGPFSDTPEEVGDIMVDLPIVLTPVHVEDCDGANFSFTDGLVWESGQGFGRFNFTDGAGNGFLVAANCGQNFQRQIQAVAHDLRATSQVLTQATNDDSPISLTVCTELNNNESARVSIDGDLLLPINHGSYLLRQSEAGVLSHRFWVEHHGESDTTEFFVTVPSLDIGTYSGDEVEVIGFRYQGTPSAYTCEQECSNVSVEVQSVNTNMGVTQVSLTFNATVNEIDLATNDIIANGLTIFGAFGINL